MPLLGAAIFLSYPDQRQESLGDFLIAPACPIEKVTPLINEIDEGVLTDCFG